MIASHDLGRIFRESGPDYRKQHKLSFQQAKVLRAISGCRTSAMGNHASKCSECGHVEVTHNSCRNRHCPQCQGLDAIQWVDKLQYDLLPIRYFHVVFTIPDSLNRLALINQKVIYDLLFRSSSDAIRQLASDKKYLGIETGCLAVLHTWGQNLMDHPHIHMLVPAGGLEIGTGNWKESPRKFFLPVKVISSVFKGKFLAGLKELYKANQLKLIGSLEDMHSKSAFKNLLDQLYERPWVVFTKKTFKSNIQVLRYLGRYTHRIAIANNRINRFDGQTITFDWKDYRDGNLKKQMTLEVDEFIRRFLLHVLPHNYHKIRYYGMFSIRSRHQRLNSIRKKLSLPERVDPFIKLCIRALIMKLSGQDITLCPNCKNGKLEAFSGTIEWPPRS